MKKILILLTALFLIMSISACNTANLTTEFATGQTETSEAADSSAMSDTKSKSTTDENNNETETETTVKMKMNVQVGERIFTAALEDNAAVRELIQMLRQEPMSIEMSDYSGFEKVGSLGKSLTTADRQTTTRSGDIVLYNGDKIVMFYGSNSWSYTKLGHIDDLTEWADTLGSGDITAVFSIAE